MTLDLDAIEARVRAATDGPWCRAHHGTWEVEAAPNQLIADFGTVDKAAEDAAFAAHARQDIPALIAEIRCLSAEVARWQADCLAIGEKYDAEDRRVDAEIVALEAERDALRGELAATLPTRITRPDGTTAEIVSVQVRYTLRIGGSWHESMSVGRWRQDFEREELRDGGRGGDRGGE